MRVLACNSAYGSGGIGQHFAHLVEASRVAGDLIRYYCPEPKSNDERGVRVDRPDWESWLLQYTPLRYSPQWQSYLNNELFDYRAARALEKDDVSAARFMGFVGKSLRSFGAAHRLGIETLELIAANSHVENVRALHAQAAVDQGIRDTWLHDREVEKTLQEYDMADVIYVHSEYTRQSFIDRGISADKLERTILHPAPRFQPPDTRPDDDIFRVVYVGRLDATKGIPLLLEAFKKLDAPKKALTLVGGWSTRRMRLFMEDWISRGLDIRLAPGDPLPALQEADVFVHPTYEDGFGYAPMEALACGIPVIATEDTGMKEYIVEGTNGFVVPTGNVDAIRNRLHYIWQHPLAQTHDLMPSSPAASPG
jgi:glycosyltransferase involved in cell wall biosynthesis